MFELQVRTPEALVEAVSEAMIDELGALSVSIEDAQAGSDAEEPIFGEPGLPVARPGWRHSVLTGLFDSEQRATDANQNDAHVFDRAIGEEPFEIILRERKRNAEQRTDRAQTDHHPARRGRHRQPAAEAHNAINAHLDRHP